MIWFKTYELSEVKLRHEVQMLAYLGIRIIELGDDYIVGILPVDNRTRQPYGILHGGASVTLAESLGSLGATLVVDPDKYYCVGIEVNANHIRSISDGQVKGVAKPLHLGKSTHVWETKITDSQDKIICISRLTMAVIERRK